MSQFMNIRRNPSRVRKSAGRNRVKPFSSMTPMGEAIYAKNEGWDRETAEPMKKDERD
jgi:hypothetical protein